MPRVKMLDTTSHRDYGPMKEGTVHEVSDEDAARLTRLGVAAKTTAKTTAETAAEEADQPLAAGPPAEEASLPDEAPRVPRQPVAMGREDVAGLTGERAERPKGAR